MTPQKGVFLCAGCVEKAVFSAEKGIFQKKGKKVDKRFRIGYISPFENALSHGVALVAKAAHGVSSFHGMADSSLRQGQIGRDKTVSVTTGKCKTKSEKLKTSEVTPH